MSTAVWFALPCTVLVIHTREHPTNIGSPQDASPALGGSLDVGKINPGQFQKNRSSHLDHFLLFHNMCTTHVLYFCLHLMLQKYLVVGLTVC